MTAWSSRQKASPPNCDPAGYHCSSPILGGSHPPGDETYKGDVTELDNRIYYTLTLKPGTGRQGELPVESRIHRTAKLLSLVVAKLQDQGMLDDEEIDEMLRERLN